MSVSPVEAIDGKVEKLRTFFKSTETKSYDFRVSQLQAIERFLKEQEEVLTKALQQDLGRPWLEAYVPEVASSLAEVQHALCYLKSWMKEESKSVPVILLDSKVSVRKDPFGVVLVIGPFNYPVALSLIPVISAIAAGNCVVLKPSELCPNVSQSFELLTQYLDSQCFALVQGGIEETQKLLKTRFDYIFFTGSERVGKIVARAAAENLTPVTLELGGKCPAVVDGTFDLEVAAKRILVNKWVNSGQTCIAPDFALVHESVYDKFCDLIKSALDSFTEGKPALESKSFSRIVSSSHVNRLASLIKSSGGQIIGGGEFDVEQKFVAPTLIRDVPLDSPLMQQEIFGPILPILRYSSNEEALAIVHKNPTPLTLYMFSQKQEFIEFMYSRFPSGAMVVGDCIFHAAIVSAPFGGIGTSGMGQYHGRYGFETFTHLRTVLTRPPAKDRQMRFPPYSEKAKKILKFAVSFGPVYSSDLSRLAFQLSGIVAAIAVAITYVSYWNQKS